MLVVGDKGVWRYGKFHGQGTYTCDGLNEYLSEWNYGIKLKKEYSLFCVNTAENTIT